jgi:hypothetical protein
MFNKFKAAVAAAQAERLAPKTETMTREYKKSKDFNKDAGNLAKKGWRVISTTDSNAKSGAGRKALTVINPILLFVPHASHIVATYERTV